MKAVIVPIIGTLITASDDLGKNLDQLEITLFIPCFDKAALLGTAFILGRALGISEFMQKSDIN